MTVAMIKRLFPLALFLLVVATIAAQDLGMASNGPLTSFADSLKARGIAIDRDSLIAALRNDDPEVRSLAAMKLGEDRDIDAIPLIENALSLEKNLRARIGLASALRTLDDPKGTEHLQAMCSDPALKFSEIVEVAQHLQMAGLSSGGCADVVLSFLNQREDPDYRSVAIALLPTMYREVSREQSEQIVRVLESLLSDEKQQLLVHIGAGHALAQIGSPLAIEIVRSALSRTEDNALRSSLQEDLKGLEKKE